MRVVKQLHFISATALMAPEVREMNETVLNLDLREMERKREVYLKNKSIKVFIPLTAEQLK